MQAAPLSRPGSVRVRKHRTSLLPCLALAVSASFAWAGFEQSSHIASADTYIERGSPTLNYGSATTVLMKRSSLTSGHGTDRISYLRFTLDTAATAVSEAVLELSISQYSGDGTTPFTFRVYGLPDGHPDEAFNESTFSFSTAANASSTASGSFNPSGLVDLGSFTPTAVSGASSIEFGGTAFRNFVASSTNQQIAIVIFRESVNNAPSYIHSSEASSIVLRPTLVVRRPATVLEPVAITASSTLVGSATANAADALAATIWSAAADNSTTKSSITFDFGSPRTANRLNFIAMEHGRRYRLETSNDNSTWSTAATDFRSGIGTVANLLAQESDVFFTPRTARYFRLSSLTSLSGKSVAFREVQFFDDASATPFITRLSASSAAVASLPNASAEEKIKRVVLELSNERALASFNAGDSVHAGRLLDDVDAGLPAPPASFSAQVSGLPNIRTLRSLAVTTTTANPYLKRMVDGANLFLAQADPPWEKNTPYVNVLEDFNLARTTGAQLDALFWLFAHPDSPLRNHPEILRRLLRRAHAYLDAVRVHGPLLNAGQLSSFYDDFAFTPASGVFRELALIHPGLLSPNASADWNDGIQTAANNLWSAYQNRSASWVNTDVAIACSLYNLGERTANPALLAKAEYFINDILTSGRMFADGAVGYIGTQNEAGGYQSLVAEYVGRYFETTGSTNAASILSQMQWYGAVNGRLADWWTSPSWKDMWNDIRSCFPAGESVAGMNPYVRGELDAWIAAPATLTNWYGRPRVDLAFYQTGVVPLARPDYTVFDRNTLGPRAWYGRWNYSATLRPISFGEAGHYTVLGAQVADPDPDFRVNASLMGIYPRLRVVPTPSRKTDNSLDENGHAWLTSGMAGDSTVTRDFSAIGVSYQVHEYEGSTKGTLFPWTARQVWLNLPDRVIGLLDIAPDSDLPAYEVQGVVRLGYGGTSFSAAKTLVSTGPDAWSYGDLRIKLHGHNYAEVVPEAYFFRSAGAPVTEITLRDAAGGASNNVPVVHPAGTRRKFLAEVRPAWAVGEVTVTEVAETGGLIGLDVDHPSTGRRYRVIYNPGNAAVSHTPNLPWSGPVRFHLNGSRHRPDWLPSPSGPLVSTYLGSGQAIQIPANGHLVLEQVSALVKADNALALDQPGTWTAGPPADAAIAEWNSTVTTPSTVTTGNGVNLAGIRITNPGGDVTIQPGAAAPLALGPAGIQLSTSDRLLTLNSPVRLDAPQTWSSGSAGAAASVQLSANAPITGGGALSLTAASDRGFAFTAANTFSGGFALHPGALLQYASAPALSAAAGAVSSGPLGTGPVSIHGGSLVAGARPFFCPDVSIHGDFTWSTTARNDTSGNFDLKGGTRTVFLTRSATPANVVVSGGNNAIRFTTVTGGITANTFANGSLRIAAAPSVTAPVLVVATFGTGGGNRFLANSGLVVGPRAYVSPSFTSAPYGSAAVERPALTLETGGFLSLSDGGSGRGHTIFSLAGSGTVLNNTSGSSARTDTLTLDGGSSLTLADFSGTLRDTDLGTFPTANPNLKTALTKAGTTTQVLSGSALHTGPTTVNGGILRVTGSLNGTSSLSVAASAVFETSGPVHVAGAITNSGTLRISGSAPFTLTGSFTNTGLLDASAWTGTLPAGIINTGTIIPPATSGTYAGWSSAVWPGVNDPLITGSSADPDRDGLINLLEWALHLDPQQPDVFSPQMTLAGPSLGYTYTRRKVTPGAAFFDLQWSDSPTGPWSSAGVNSTAPDSLSETRESISATLPAGAAGKRFVRVQVSTP